MKKRKMKDIILKIELILLLLFFLETYVCQGQNHKVFNMAYSKSTTISINKSYSKSSIVYPFKDKEPVFSLAIKASVQLDGYKSMIRVILVAENGNEFLVMESYYMIAETDKIEFSDYGDETALLNGIIPSRIKIEIENATILLESFSYNNNSLNRLKK